MTAIDTLSDLIACLASWIYVGKLGGVIASGSPLVPQSLQIFLSIFDRNEVLTNLSVLASFGFSESFFKQRSILITLAGNFKISILNVMIFVQSLKIYSYRL